MKQYEKGCGLKTCSITILIVALGLTSALAQEATEFECLLEPHMEVSLGTPVPGVLSEVLVDRGEVIRKNQLLAKLDSRAQQAAVELGRARVEFAKRRIARNAELVKDGLVSQQTSDELETELLLAELELKERRVQVALRDIVSPIAGVVVERVRSPGDFVQETEILRLAQIDPLNVEVIVPVATFGSIQTGTKATVKPRAPVGGVYDAKVTVIDKVIDAASNTFRVRLEIPNGDLTIPAGLRCTIELEFDRPLAMQQTE